MKSFIRFLAFLFCLSGWAIVAFCVYVVRVPDPADAQKSKLIVVPKNRLSIEDTYIDARGWTLENVKDHKLAVMRIVYIGKADELKFLADPKNNKDIETQLTDYLSDTPDGPTTHSSTSRAGFVK